MSNRFKELLDAGKPAIGSQLRFGNPAIAEMFGHAGFDWLLLDSEHAPQTPSGIQAQLQAIGNTPATPIMRLPSINSEQIRLYLDMGAMGLAAAFVNTSEEAEFGARLCKYPPHGIRGWGPHRAAHYGLMGNDQYQRQVADKVMFIPIIETAEAVDNIETIMAVDGVDTILIGPADLSISLGSPFDFTCQNYRDAQRKVIDACRLAGKPAGTAMLGSPFDPEILQSHLDLGFSVVMVGGDEWFLTGACGMVKDSRKQCGC